MSVLGLVFLIQGDERKRGSKRLFLGSHKPEHLVGSQVCVCVLWGRSETKLCGMKLPGLLRKGHTKVGDWSKFHCLVLEILRTAARMLCRSRLDWSPEGSKLLHWDVT